MIGGEGAKPPRRPAGSSSKPLAEKLGIKHGFAVVVIRPLFFFLNYPAPTDIYPLPLHHALPILQNPARLFPHGAFSHRSLDRPPARRVGLAEQSCTFLPALQLP